jgi:hypothetical protein
MTEAGIGDRKDVAKLLQEAREILAIFTAAARTSKGLQ